MIVPELRQLRYVVEVAQQRSFTRAAERLHVAQQALSQQVRAVEDQLGVRLFDRGNRGVELTAAGTIFVQEARKAITAAERVVTRTQAAGRGEVGAIRICHTLAAAYETVPAIIDELTRTSPGLRVEQREIVATDIEPALLNGDQDIALCPRTSIPAGIQRTEIRREPFVAAVGDTHPLASQPQISVAELAEDDFQLWPREVSPGYHDAVLAICRDAGFEPRLGQPASGATVWGNIAAGRGVGLVVRSLQTQVPRGVALIDLAPPAPALIIDLLWATDNDSPAVQRARDAAGSAAATMRWL